MKALYKNPIAIIFAVFAVAGFIYFQEQLPAIDLSHLTPGNVIAMLGYLSIIMLVVEQFIEIFVSDPEEKIKIQSKNRIAIINKFLESLNPPINPIMIHPESSIDNPQLDQITKVIKEKKELEELLISMGLKRQKKMTIIAFVIGLILSFSGLRFMSGILFSGLEVEPSSIQTTIIQTIDIILTAGIIAGGSGRVHRLIKRIKQTLQPE